MSSAVLKYIKEEKEISKYKLQALKKGAKKQYKERLAALEEDFLDYPFEKLNLSSLDEIREAMNLFKSDRHSFYSIHENTPASKRRGITESQISLLKKKNLFYRDKYKYLLDNKIKEINLIQNDYVRSLYKGKDIDFGSHGIDYMLDLEGAGISKVRARIQILIYCLARAIFNKTKDIEITIDSGLDSERYDEVRLKLGSFFSDISRDIFRFYNEAISEVPLLINGTLGHNNFVSTIYPLTNALDKFEGDFVFRRLLPKEKTFFANTGKFISKKFVDRGYGLITPISRIGNESIALLYVDLWSSSGIRLSPVFESKFFNYKVNGKYYKAISAKPIIKWKTFVDNPYLERELSSLLGTSNSLSSGVDLSSDENKKAVNAWNNSSIFLDTSISKIMIPSTRSESDHIRQAAEYVSIIISSIEQDFMKEFSSN